MILLGQFFLPDCDVKKQDQLLEQFVSSFLPESPTGDLLLIKHETAPEQLTALYDNLPCRFPPMFEKLLLTYRWCCAGATEFRLLDNPPGVDLSGFYESIVADKHLSSVCMQNGYIPFGRAAESYDPVCFDCNKRSSRRNFEVVTLDHELILRHSEVKKLATLARSFDELIESSISS